MHWGYTGFIIPLILIIVLIGELKRKRPPHIDNGDYKKDNTNGTMRMEKTYIGRPKKRMRITPPLPQITPKRVRLER